MLLLLLDAVHYNTPLLFSGGALSTLRQDANQWLEVTRLDKDLWVPVNDLLRVISGKYENFIEMYLFREWLLKIDSLPHK